MQSSRAYCWDGDTFALAVKAPAMVGAHDGPVGGLDATLRERDVPVQQSEQSVRV